MSNILNDEKCLCSIKCHKNIKNSTKIVNFVTNLLSFGVAGMVTNDFKLTLTSENLYIEAIGYATWGGLPETMYTDKISRENIKSFEVKSEYSEEIIVINTTDDKTMTFIRDNEKNNNLAFEMGRLVSKEKEN